MIIIKNLKKAFGKEMVLNGVSASIKKGEIVAILGSSGSGKSTLLRCINDLEHPTSGEILINDIQVNAAHIQRIREKVGMVFQNFHLFSNMKVMQNLVYAPTRLKKLSFEEATQKALGLLKTVGLEKKANAYPKTLSGGEKQRIAIARALMVDPEVILFDEPTSALDPEMVQEVLKVIKSLASTGITILIVTHEMNFVREVATRVLFLDKGVILEDQNTHDFFEGHSNERIAQFLNKKPSVQEL